MFHQKTARAYSGYPMESYSSIFSSLLPRYTWKTRSANICWIWNFSTRFLNSNYVSPKNCLGVLRICVGKLFVHIFISISSIHLENSECKDTLDLKFQYSIYNPNICFTKKSFERTPDIRWNALCLYFYLYYIDTHEKLGVQT